MHESSICDHFRPEFFPLVTLLNALVSRCHYLSILTVCSSPLALLTCVIWGRGGCGFASRGTGQSDNGLSHQLKRLYRPKQAGSDHKLPLVQNRSEKLPLVQNRSEQLPLRSIPQNKQPFLQKPRTREGSIFGPEAGKEATGSSLTETQRPRRWDNSWSALLGAAMNCISSLELLRPTQPGF